MEYFVYILANKTNSTIYVGVTNNLVRRIWEHKNKVVSGFTQKYNLTKLVYYEVFVESMTAINREKTIKNMVRRKKNLLIEKINPEWKDLYPGLL